MGFVLLLVWIGFAASASFNAALLVRIGQLRTELAEHVDTIESLRSALGGSSSPGNESWRNDVL